MATVKVTVLSSSSSICGKSHLLVDKWVCRIKNTSYRSISGNSSIVRKRILGVRVLMDTERIRSKGSMNIFDRKGMSFGLINGGVANRGLEKNWRSYGKKSLSSETNGFVSEMVSKEDEKEKKEEEEERNQEEQTEKLLTLPTILTIGRVAAVPLLISSRVFCFENYYIDSSYNLNCILLKDLIGFGLIVNCNENFMFHGNVGFC